MNDIVQCQISGPYACFTDFRFGCDGHSYPFITPSAARNIFQNIHWKKGEFNYEIVSIGIQKPIQFTSLMLNEFKSFGLNGPGERTQRSRTILVDVSYLIKARIVPCDGQDHGHVIGKHSNMFDRFLRRSAFRPPYLGMSDFDATYKPIDELSPQESETLNLDIDFGIVFYDFNYDKYMTPRFFHARVTSGWVITDPRKIEIK